MSEAILTFQAQLSSIMETVLKTAVFEITWLVESSFQGEVMRCRQEVDTLRRKLQAADRRCRGAVGDSNVTCEKCGRNFTDGPEPRVRRMRGGLTEGCVIKQEEEAERSANSCLIDTSDPPPTTPSRPLDPTPTTRSRRLQTSSCAERSGPDLTHQGQARGPQETLKGVESSGRVYVEDVFSKDSAQLPEGQGREEGPKGTRLDGPAQDYAAYDRAAVTGAGESAGDGRDLSPTATIGEGIQIKNVMSLSRPQLSSANHVGRRVSGKARHVVAVKQQPLELAPSSHNAAGARPAVSAAGDASTVSYSAPRDARSLRGVAAGDKQQISCAFCGKSFSYESRLRTHLLKHTGEKPFSCAQCGKRFTIARNLERHQHIHWGEAAFGCPHCAKRFKRADHLKVHQRVHTGERPYRCALCGKCFRFSGDLNTHKRVHTGEKPYCCSLCGSRFSQLRQLKSHQRHHRGPGRLDPLI
ncbi:hypothetical protein GJAV_G00156170 [Gymnothorax javanicus]|nr:hypothetical protein GJAV_G00156170 [Gymnothorax javanicus]